MFDKQWIFNKAQHDEYLQHISARGQTGGAPSFIDEIFYKRGITGAAGAPEELSDPYGLPDMDKAVDRILTAAEEGERVAVFGDYDADGVTASAVLYHFLQNMLEMDVLCYIPDRISEGYGMSQSAIDKLAEQSVTLIVTVDNGIVAFKEIEYAMSLGIDVVVTDHHRCADHLPECSAVVDPCILQETTPASFLCGAGVAFALVSALADSLGLYEEIQKYIPIVMIGTIGDSVPLIGDNRIIVKFGLAHIYDYGWIGIEQLLARINEGRQGRQTEMNSTFITFYVVPKLNAAGRLGNAERAFALLLTQEDTEASRLADALMNENAKRQAAELEITEKAMLPENNAADGSDAVTVAIGEGWHHGVIGIVASRLTEKSKKPSFVLVKEEGGLARGSARSVKGFDIYKALSGCAPLLERFGGHEMAAGLTIKTDNIPAFIEHMNRFAADNAQYIAEPPNVEVDAVLLPEEITVEACARLDALEPHGVGNPQPMLCVRGLYINSCAKVGDGGKHLKMSFGAETKDGRHIALNGIAFSQGAYEQMVRSIDGVCSVICKAEINAWQGRETVSLIVSDIYDGDYDVDNALKCVYNSDYATCEGFALERGVLVVMYKMLLGFGESFKFNDLYRVRSDMRKRGIPCTWYEIRNGIDVFTELGLIERTDRQNFKIVKNPSKTDLGASAVFNKAQVVR